MNRLVFAAILMSFVMIPQSVLVSLARAGGDTDADLWSAAGVTRITERIAAPAVVLNDLGGERVDLRDFRGRVVMLYFWATW